MKALLVFACLLGCFAVSYGISICGCKPDVPVCGTDFKTYPSLCDLECYPNDGSIKVMYVGTCEEYIRSLQIPVYKPALPSPNPTPIGYSPPLPSPRPTPIGYSPPPQPYLPIASSYRRSMSSRRCSSGRCY